METSQTKGIEVRQTVALLRRCLFIEQSCIRSLAIWFLGMPRYELKIGMGYQIWAHAERVTELRGRLAEMRGGHHEANVEPSLVRLADGVTAAPDAVSFLHGWREVVAALAAAYQDYLGRADPAANAQEIRVLRRLEADAQQSLAWARNALPAGTQGWPDHVAGLLDAAGGVGGDNVRSGAAGHFPAPAAPRWPAPFVFDDRISEGEFADYDRRMDLDFGPRRVAELEIYFNEFYAAGLLATILVDAWNAAAPWEFYRDLCHHFWDEVRHSEFGMVRLRELGVEPSRVNLVLFHASRDMPFLHRLCYLTLGLEVFFMPRKRPRVQRYAEAGDRRTQLFADVDWSDESNHVQYGKRWVDYFLREDARSVAELQEEVAGYLRAAGLQIADGQLAPY